MRSETAIEDWPQESRPACSRKGWAKELLQQNLDVVHWQTVRIGRGLTLQDLRDLRLGENEWKWPAESTIAAACVIQYRCCAGGTAAAQWRTVSHLVHAQPRLWSQSWNCDGMLTPPVQWTQTGKRTMREPRPTNFLRNACLTSCAPTPPLIRLKIDHGWITALHKTPVGNSGCHLPERHENMRHRFTANPKPTSTVATQETTPCIGRSLV